MGSPKVRKSSTQLTFGCTASGTSICLYLKVARTERLTTMPPTKATPDHFGSRLATTKLHTAVRHEDTTSSIRNQNPSVAYIARLPAVSTRVCRTGERKE